VADKETLTLEHWTQCLLSINAYALAFRALRQWPEAHHLHSNAAS